MILFPGKTPLRGDRLTTFEPKPNCSRSYESCNHTASIRNFQKPPLPPPKNQIRPDPASESQTMVKQNDTIAIIVVVLVVVAFLIIYYCLRFPRSLESLPPTNGPITTHSPPTLEIYDPPPPPPVHPNGHGPIRERNGGDGHGAIRERNGGDGHGAIREQNGGGDGHGPVRERPDPVHLVRERR